MDTNTPATPAPQPPPIILPPAAAPTPAPAFKRSTFALPLKLAIIAAIALLLLIPLALVHETLGERQMRYNQAVDTIRAAWGNSQSIIGPILVVPITHKVETEEWVTGSSPIAGITRVKEKKTTTITTEAYFLPDQLNFEGTLEPHKRTRSIHTAHVYTASLRITGKFDRPDTAFPGLQDVQPQWDRARLAFRITDLRGVRESVTLNYAGENIAMQPGSGYDATPGLQAALPAPLAQNGGEFSLALTLNGSDTFEVAPLARSTKMHLTSDWPDPSFCGDYLPVKRDVNAGGFNALWETSYYARTVPQKWTGDANTIPPQNLAEGSFGVRMLPAVSAYRTVERSIKYGILFIALTFTIFFLFETLARVRLNALNYLLVGATLCVFFLGLLALSEFVSFTPAYAISAAIATLMIGFYCAHILHSAKRTAAITLLLGGVYAYLYFVLRMEDLALIAGTAALFAVLAALMFATRNLRTDPPAA